MDLSLKKPRRRKDLRLDATDEAIIWELAANARLSNRALADRLGIAQSTCLTRVQRLQDEGVLLGAYYDLDVEALGFAIQALVAVRIRAQSRDAINSYGRRVIMLPNVTSVVFVGGEDDFLIHVVCVSTAQLRDFVATQLSMDPAVAGTRTNIIFEALGANAYRGRKGSFADMRGDY